MIPRTSSIFMFWLVSPSWRKSVWNKYTWKRSYPIAWLAVSYTFNCMITRTISTLTKWLRIFSSWWQWVCNKYKQKNWSGNFFASTVLETFEMHDFTYLFCFSSILCFLSSKIPRLKQINTCETTDNVIVLGYNTVYIVHTNTKISEKYTACLESWRWR